MARLGQNFLADPNLLAAIIRAAELEPADVVLEVGGGEGVLTAALAPRVATVHVVELDERLRPALEAVAAEHPNVRLCFGDALRIDLGALDPAPTAVVSNLPYSIATPLLLRTIAELAGVSTWTVMVQREIADRLRAAPGTRAYGAPSVLVQLACEVRLLRTVDRAVFVPRPRVDSALLRLERRGDPPSPRLAALVRAAFAHRRKALAGSLALVAERGGGGGVGSAGGAGAGDGGAEREVAFGLRKQLGGADPVAVREAARAALVELGLPADARAEQLSPDQFALLDEKLAARELGKAGG